MSFGVAAAGNLEGEGLSVDERGVQGQPPELSAVANGETPADFGFERGF